jgi:predicted nucleic acid-binding protein
MRYLDTSIVVSLLRPEPATATVQRWVARNAASGLHVSDWVTVEVSSALSILQRTGELDAAARAQAQQTYELLSGNTLEVLTVRRSAYALAAKWTAQPELSLRAGDALHLAVASVADLELVTRDVQQARAARAVGVTVKEIGST